VKVFNIIFIILFIISAFLQYNDPDPYIWIPLYLFGAYLCFEALKRRYRPGLYIAGFLVYIGYALYLFFDKNGVLTWAQEHDAENIAATMKATKPWIEETREFGGLLILIIALIVNAVWLRRLRKATGAASLQTSRPLK
jgi:hypothetical protein